MDQMRVFEELVLGTRTKRLSDLLMAEVQVVYDARDIALSPGFFSLFYLIHTNGPVTVTDAAAQLGVSHPFVSKMATRMVSEGWLEKVSDPRDERRQRLFLSPKAEKTIPELQPIWNSLKQCLREALTEAQKRSDGGNFLQQMTELEDFLSEQSLSSRTLDRLESAEQKAETRIIGWSSDHRTAFRDINTRYLHALFPGEITEQDEKRLENPEATILATGGAIFLAQNKERIVGTCCLIAHPDDRYEIAKLTVAPDYRGTGTGRKLLLKSLGEARQLGARTVFLESNSSLKSALRLYERTGFRTCPPPSGLCSSSRCNLYMELDYDHA
ncbi:bifunctional helix-turn-helix transcriptional regulator/GNAT family N-acetyltransferase [Kiloniella sp. b19]|uniref:bifunctional helix-turn-helix transcriptional regulator/GNAT family N-acetyltransferase n=1 Tax=Kiloniella sp. GXU_MW_B19 TaxID=3141326 RepID=UPI0031DFAFF2